MSNSKKFAFDVGITFISSSISMIIGFIITILLGRYLGAGELGLYRMASTIYGVAMLVGAIGIPAAMIKFVAACKGDISKTNAIVSAGIITSLFLGIVFSLIFYLSSEIFGSIFNMPELSGGLKLLSPVFPFALVNGALLGLLNGLREMKKYGIATIIQSVLMILITVSLIYYGFGVSGAIIGIVLSFVGSCLYLLWVSKGYFKIESGEYFSESFRLLRFGWKIVAINGINQINYQADTILIGYFLTMADVGYYGVAVGLSKFFWLVPQAIQLISYPATSEYWSNDNHSALQMIVDKSVRYTAYILLPVGMGIGFFAKDIVTLIFGKSFLYAILPLQILIIGSVFFGIFISIGSVLTGVGRPDLSLKINSIGAIINIILNIALIPFFGISGAAIATVTSYLIIIFFSIHYMIKIGHIIINIKPYILLFLITIFAVALFIILNWINIYLIGFLILILYVIAIFVFVVTEEDKKIFTSLIRLAIFVEHD